MAVFLGVDTGGTYTDAVLLMDDERVLAKAKALTTRHDLAVGIGRAIDAVLAESTVAAADISLVSLSTTLATNALVEGQGGRVALVSIGFSAADLARQGLGDALGNDPVISLKGGHSHAGAEVAPLDTATLLTKLTTVAGTVSAFAVAGQFATRNPAHEIAVRDLIAAKTGKPVSCSHDLSAKLNGPKRAMTAVLNARLIGLIDHLISAAQSLLQARKITAPLMVVRGDGALISAVMARLKPIETILSGPAASLVGARWLTGQKDALVSDIGGTTTDIGLLRDGRPRIDPLGARVGPHRTMVEAVAMRTIGLGGDSEVHVVADGLAGGLALGPKRVLPVCLCAVDWPDLVHASLERRLSSDRVGEYDGRFVLPLRAPDPAAGALDQRESWLLERVGDAAHDISAVVFTKMEHLALNRLVARGILQISALTPTDAAHALGLQSDWDVLAAKQALALFAGQRSGNGEKLAADGPTLARQIIARLEHQTLEALLAASFAAQGQGWDGVDPETLAHHVLLRRGLEHHRGLIALDAALNVPLVGLGASAKTYYGAVGARLGCDTILPENGDVANAIGAVVGQISMRETGSITSPSDGRFLLHLPEGPQEMRTKAEALQAMESHLRKRASTAARAAGAVDIRLSVKREIRQSTVEGRDMFVDAELTVTASGRPRIAEG